MLHVAYIVIFSNQILNIKQEETRLLLKGLKIGRKKKKKLHNHVGAHNIALAIFFLIILIKFLLKIFFFF